MTGTDIDLGRHNEAMPDLQRSIGGSSLSLDLRPGRVDAHLAGIYSDPIAMEISPI